RQADRRPLARLDLLPPARRARRGGSHEFGLRHQRRRPELGVAWHGARRAAGHMGRARGAAHQRAAGRPRQLRRAGDRRGELVRAHRPGSRRRRQVRADRRRPGDRCALPRRVAATGGRLPHLLRGAPARREPRTAHRADPARRPREETMSYDFYMRPALNVETYDLRTDTGPDSPLHGGVDFFLTLAQQTGGPALELGPGTGRVTWPLAEAGIEVRGLELSPAM